MQKLNLIKREKKWKMYHQFGKEQKARSLRKMSEKDGINIFRRLYQFAYNSSGESGFNILDKNRIKTLTRVHHIFNKVKVGKGLDLKLNY